MAHPQEVYEKWIKPGDLVFDIGANVGLRTAVFLDMGCRVISVEPNPKAAAHIDKRATVRCCGVGAKSGEVLLLHLSDRDYLNTFSQEYIEKSAESWPGEYSGEIAVPMITLDWMIAAYGVPAFCKIDVEGFEDKVLYGLSEPLPALSFEVHPFQPEKIAYCLERLSGLGNYALSYSDRESFEIEPWTGKVGLFGDIYAELQA